MLLNRSMQSQWTRVHGRKMHARRGGMIGKPAIVLVHGLGVSSAYLVPTAQVLASDHAVYAPDLPGFGRSESPRRALDIAALATELLSWMDVMKLERPVLLGNSMGCQILVALAVAAPERVDRLVLVGPTVDPRWRSFARQIPRWLLEATREPLSIFPILASDYLRCGPRRFFATGRFALMYEMEHELPRVVAPALVVRGERDAFVSSAWVDRVTSLLPYGQSATIAGAAHAANYSAPEALARLVRAFVAQSAKRSEDRDPRAARMQNGRDLKADVA